MSVVESQKSKTLHIATGFSLDLITPTKNRIKDQSELDLQHGLLLATRFMNTNSLHDFFSYYNFLSRLGDTNAMQNAEDIFTKSSERDVLEIDNYAYYFLCTKADGVMNAACRAKEKYYKTGNAGYLKLSEKRYLQFLELEDKILTLANTITN